MNALAKTYLPRHYMTLKSTTANTGGVFQLTVEDVVGDDRGSIPVTVTGEDKQDHTSYINVYSIGRCSRIESE